MVFETEEVKHLHCSSSSFMFFFSLTRWPLGWLGHHQIGPTRPADLVVAEPPPWPRGGQPLLVGGSATLLLFYFFFL
jgi:hypothetical protein